MHTRRLTTHRTEASQGAYASLIRKSQMALGGTLFVLGGLGLVVLLAAIPKAWAVYQMRRLNAAFQMDVFDRADPREDYWTSMPHVPLFAEGHEREVREMLDLDPLIIAVWDRQRQRLWVRELDRLREASPEEPHPLPLRRWILMAELSGHFQWSPNAQENHNLERGPAVLTRSERYTVVKQWQRGSPEVELALRRVFGPRSPMRLGMFRPSEIRPSEPTSLLDRFFLLDFSPPQHLTPQAWGTVPNLQIDAYTAYNHALGLDITSSVYPGWTLVCLPRQPRLKDYRETVIYHYRAAIVVCSLAGLILGTGLWLRYRARRHTNHQADRLASLTHSLKTPLAILKFRCDSIRLGRLDPDRVDAELIKIGDDVDQLTLLIENTLTAVRGVSESGPRDTVTPAWLMGVAEDLASAFEAEGRALKLKLSHDQGRALLSSLRPALLTLLENALAHGKGPVTLTSTRTRRRLNLCVRDEGPGLDRRELEALGKPFMRLRNQGQEGFMRQGQGLGLSLLIQVAEKEGWGLTFASAKGSGFTACLEIHAG